MYDKIKIMFNNIQHLGLISQQQNYDNYLSMNDINDIFRNDIYDLYREKE